ncbi:glycosyltransferase family 4 protein [Thermofilum pendens]|uniref:Glycosyl transferase, group 1 n=1 Tax=Thermofilum pendens (strain DSM 2475 / Hrk 5) TaxID=368408 RepID=A1S0Y7_THEPD|nr:glycosyltransferase family 4 protein [Thermofilum pendens]ABL79117.1 glycosyl transferase, group 1 [Thermofilum pendens Hrk 5]
MKQVQEFSHKGKYCKKLRIAFVHNYYIHYRVPLFKALSRVFHVKFFFDDVYEYVKKPEKELDFVINKGPRIKGIRLPVTLLFHLLKQRPHLVIAGDSTYPSTLIAFLTSKMLRAKFILWEERWFWHSSLLSNLLWPFSRTVALKADALIVPGTLSKEFYKNIGVEKGRIFVAPNASYVDINEEIKNRARALRRKLGLDNKIVVLYIGRVIPLKGVHLILKALTKINEYNLHLLIPGTFVDPWYKRLLDDIVKASKLESKVTMLSLKFVRVEDRGIYYELADIVCYPSYYEAWGMVVNEAAYAGKPVISTRTCAAAYDILFGHPELVIPPGNVEELAKSLKLLAMDANKRKAIGMELKRLISEKYSYEEMLKGFLKAIKYTLVNQLTEQSQNKLD